MIEEDGQDASYLGARIERCVGAVAMLRRPQP
jgi:hypothetical protein